VIQAVHALLYAPDAERAREFFRDALGWRSVDAGGGWLIFATPPAELAVHPAADGARAHHELSFMCDDIEATIAELKAKGAEFPTPVSDHRWGRLTTMRIPGGVEIALYQPLHASPLDLTSKP